MSNYKTLFSLALLIFLPLSLLGEKIAVIDFKPIGVDPSLAEVTTTLLRSDVSSYKNISLVEVGEKIECDNKERAAEIGLKIKAQKVVYGTISKLGTKYIISAYVVEVSTRNIVFQDRVTASSAEDLDTASKRLAKAIATGKKVEDVAEIGAITEEETKEPRRRKTFFTLGGKFGMGFPFADSYGGVKTLMSGDFIYWYETPKFIAEFGVGGTVTPITTTMGFSDTTVGETDITMRAAEFTYAQMSLFYLFSKEDFCPYAGGGIGMKNCIITRDYPGFWDDYSESAFGLALNFNAGLIIFRTYDFRMLIEGQYSLNMANFATFGGPHHAFKINFGFTYKKEKDGGCGGCIGGGCL
ncbi:MAG: hypothetical protein E3J87_07285 [Candidatus Cloacimonadota bacterium]|nr:MAG: hypothetical protein E3J87_07285 [Candidatus Cloacimonadota bacterium]